MAKAELIAKRRIDFADGYVLEIVVWVLPTKTEERPHGYKYRLYYGDEEGNCLVRYDNETGKGDHKHLGKREFPYRFIDINTLFSDFEDDVDHMRLKHRSKINE